jgi:hypothetical protein
MINMPYLIYAILRNRSLNSLFIEIRELRYLLSPNSYCCFCGQKVKHKWFPIREFFMDASLDTLRALNKPTKTFDPIHIGCRFCDPFFEAIGVYEEIVIEENDKPLESWT